MGSRARYHFEEDVDLTAYDVVHGRTSAAVRDVRELHIRERREQFCKDVRKTSDARRRDGHAARLLPRRIKQLLEVLEPALLARHEDAAGLGEINDRLELRERIVGLRFE